MAKWCSLTCHGFVGLFQHIMGSLLTCVSHYRHYNAIGAISWRSGAVCTSPRRRYQSHSFRGLALRGCMCVCAHICVRGCLVCVFASIHGWVCMVGFVSRITNWMSSRNITVSMNGAPCPPCDGWCAVTTAWMYVQWRPVVCTSSNKFAQWAGCMRTSTLVVCADRACTLQDGRRMAHSHRLLGV